MVYAGAVALVAPISPHGVGTPGLGAISAVPPVTWLGAGLLVRSTEAVPTDGMSGATA